MWKLKLGTSSGEKYALKKSLFQILGNISRLALTCYTGQPKAVKFGYLWN